MNFFTRWATTSFPRNIQLVFSVSSHHVTIPHVQSLFVQLSHFPNYTEVCTYLKIQQTIYNLWWRNWQWDTFFSGCFCFPSLIAITLQLLAHTIHLSLTLYGRDRAPSLNTNLEICISRPYRKNHANNDSRPTGCRLRISKVSSAYFILLLQEVINNLHSSYTFFLEIHGKKE